MKKTFKTGICYLKEGLTDYWPPSRNVLKEGEEVEKKGNHYVVRVQRSVGCSLLHPHPEYEAEAISHGTENFPYANIDKELCVGETAICKFDVRLTFFNHKVYRQDHPQ